MFLVELNAACAINSIANGASIVAVCPVSRFENRSTSLSNRAFISFIDDFCSRRVTITYINPAIVVIEHVIPLDI
jgi:hypothetical protein